MRANDERLVVEVGGENLDVRPRLAPRRLLQQQNGQAIRLLAGGAGGRPHPDRLISAGGIEQQRDHLAGERGEGGGVAEKAGDRNQQVVEQRAELVGPVAQIGEIILHARGLRHLHAPGDAAQQRGALVAGKILAEPRAQLRENAPQGVLVAHLALLRHPRLRPRQSGETAREFGDRQYEIRAAGDGGARHGAEFRLVGVLRQHDAAILANGAHAQRAVRTAAAQHDGETVAVLVGQRAEEFVDRRPLAARLGEGGGRDLLVGDQQAPIGGDHIDSIGTDRLGLVDLLDRHCGAVRQDRRQFAAMSGVEMDQHDIGEAEIGRKRLEQALQGFDPARRGADADDGDARERAAFSILNHDRASLTTRKSGVDRMAHTVAHFRPDASAAD